MKKDDNKKELCLLRVLQITERLVSVLFGTFLLFVFAYLCFVVWDTWQIYDKATIKTEQMIDYGLTDQNNPDLEQLLLINQDICAWLTVADTGINYPIVQGEDNTAYINTDIYGDFSLAGSIFLDSRNKRTFDDPYSLLYGHHMENDLMFGSLTKFNDSSYFDEHPTGTLYLPEQTYIIEIFACVQTSAYDKMIFDPTIYQNTDLNYLLDHITKQTSLYRAISLNSGDKLLAMSTCSDVSTDARTVVIGRLIPENEYSGGNENDY